MTNKLHYREYGTGEPLYFFHGFALDKTSMEYIYEPYFNNQSGYRLVYIDLPGMGESALGTKTSSTDDVFEIIRDFILFDSNEHQINICGHSFGAYLCLGLSYELREKVNKIFLTCPVLKVNQNDRIIEKHTNTFEEKIENIENEEAYNDFIDMNILINNETWNDYKNSIIPGLKLFDSIGWEKIQNNSYTLNFEHKIISNPPNTRGYILLGEYDNVVGYQDQIKTLIDKKVTCKVLANSGHNLQIDSKKELEKYFRDFFSYLIIG